MNLEPKFIADASLAGLSKWLRLLGFDTVVYKGEAGRPMMRQATAEGRILLTRRRDMLERQFAGYVHLLPPIPVGGQLSLLVNKLSLEIHPEKMFQICLICNDLLQPCDRNEATDLVPSYVHENTEKFTRCNRCDKIYWPGTHGRNALNFLKENGIILRDMTVF